MYDYYPSFFFYIVAIIVLFVVNVFIIRRHLEMNIYVLKNFKEHEVFDKKEYKLYVLETVALIMINLMCIVGIFLFLLKIKNLILQILSF